MQILHRPISTEKYPASAETRCPELLACYLQHFPEAVPANIDFEDWAENTTMLAALETEAHHLGVPFRLLETGGPAHFSGQSGLTPPAKPAAPDTVMWGLFNQRDAFEFPEAANLLWNNREACHTVTRWPLSETFRRHAGRHVELLDMDFEAVRAAFARLKAHGHTQGFLKTTEKSWTQIVDLSEDIPSDIGWDIIANEGVKNALILQGVIQPRCEYRMFVVGNAVITGAGCIEAFTPLDRLPHTANPFDTRVEAVRNKPPHHDDPELIERYREFSQNFAIDWAAEHGRDTAYTLDLCIDAATYQIVPIELNPMTNTGLYASDPVMLARALTEPFAAARRDAAQ